MASNSYDFWVKGLKSPKYVVAPMVDMSELPFRALCRTYKADLCYTPMIHAKRYLRDVTYRSRVFSTCTEDRPLIIQLCANDAETFLKAAELLQDHCDAVDLNLGCPQMIAKRGNYGSFLQDDWNLITDIVRTASENLSVPVTCKIRIHSDLDRTVQYAQMIEKAGAKVLTVHGRTRDQRQHLTGRADWDIIKAIKQAISIPVIANGNILDFEDVTECLQYTNADAVMSAEGILHNPALFSGVHPHVCDIAQEFLDLCKIHLTDIGHIRTHLFWLFAYSLPHYADLQVQLGMANTAEKLQNVVDDLKMRLIHIKEIYAPVTDDRYTLEPWLCHSRPRVRKKCDGTTVRCNIQGRDDTESNTENVEENSDMTEDHGLHMMNLSDEEADELESCVLTKAEKKRMRVELKLAGKKIRRKKQLINRRQKLREERLLLQDATGCAEEHVSKYDKKQILKERLMEAMTNGLRICVDLSLENYMSEKECGRLAQQLCRLYGYNKNSAKPVSLHFSGFDKSGILYAECVRKNTGFDQYIIDMHEESHCDLFDADQIVYLSPDSDNVLEELDMSKVYVIGGLVDESVNKGITQTRAASSQIQTARLPIDEYMTRSDVGSYSRILALNQVFQILLTYHTTSSWPEALKIGVPVRKGFILKEQCNRS